MGGWVRIMGWDGEEGGMDTGFRRSRAEAGSRAVI